MPATSYAFNFHRDEDSRPTLVTALGTPCRDIGGCDRISVAHGRCSLHQATRISSVPTVGKLVEPHRRIHTRDVDALVALAVAHLADANNMRAALAAEVRS